ncbi:MAG: CotH kinase family protein [bacterium]|nr:CotH kinase family protein [bacterium]
MNLKHVIVLFLWAFASIPAFGQGFYDVNSVRTIELIFPQSNWDEILDSLYEAGDEERLIGTAIIDGVVFDSVGIRYKGQSTYSTNRVKSPFNIKLDHIRDNQEIDGYGTLKLSNAWFDPSFVREVLGYEIARKYMPASLSNYANVYVNGTLLGLYVNVQDVDKLFMRTHFHSDGNARFKGEISGPSQVYVVWGYLGQDSAAYQIQYELDSDAGWKNLIDFLDTLNNFPDDVEAVLDIDRHLWMLAFDNLLVNLDSPINFGHNFYLYQDDSHRFNPIIWDLNMCFGSYRKVYGTSGLNLTQMQELSPFFNETNPNYPIISKIFTNPTYKKMYIAHMKTMLEENFLNGWYQTRALELQEIIDADVAADPNPYTSYGAFLSNINGTVGMIPGIVQLMSARAAYLSDLSPIDRPAPIISTITHSPQVVEANQNLTIVASVTNATVVRLAYRDNRIEPFTRISMVDDGLHSDGAANDGVYGATLLAGSTDIHYYIYAENVNAAKFEPQRAEYEDSVITVISSSSSDIVINEFLASNSTGILDPAGEYEDWIELYNPTSSAISLTGHHLSDNIANPGKWAFPDTSISPQGYIIVWADEDGGQPGLHASFKLSAGGEAVVLTSPEFVMIDSVTFGAQTTDVSMGRCPGGSESWTFMTPTAGTGNNCPTAECGDLDGSGAITIVDVVFFINYMFSNGPEPEPLAVADVDCSGSANISDVVFLVNFVFGGGNPPCSECQ